MTASEPKPTHPSPNNRFLPGQRVGLKSRFRIISLLGKGSMGEVYRADDLDLGGRVALKFLPETRQADEVWRRRLKQEIRLALEISHPYVCRVHDVDEHEGALFVVMECIEGEDLFRLLWRFGRDAEGNPTMPLPIPKALELAHQLCAGLAAIHDQGILHRDLKPANIIINDRGLAKITDFGLAGWLGKIRYADEGTKPYMAPEQLENREVTSRSDLYALGLVLYELFTARQAFAGTSRQGLIPPCAVNPGLDPKIGEAIMSCLEPEPARRPASARQLARALPEHVPEPVAPKERQFPPPEVLLVPGAGERRLRPRVAWAGLAALVIGLLLVAFLGTFTHLPRFLDAKRSPVGLAEKALDTAEELGYEQRAHTVYGFTFNRQRLVLLNQLLRPTQGWDALATGAMSPLGFWYRQSPAPLTPFDPIALLSYEDPPATVAGTVGLQLDPQGRLRRFEALGSDPAPDSTPAGNRLLISAPAAPAPAGPAGAHRWQRGWGRVSQTLVGLYFALALAAAAYYARRNFLSKRADRSAALRLMLFFIAVSMTAWLFGTRHTLGREGFEIFCAHLAQAFFYGGLAWLLYTALEPLLRRDCPERMVSWVRLMHGRFRDPLVGRHVFMGVLGGVLALLVAQLCLLTPAWLGRRLPDPGDLTVVVLVRQPLLDFQLEALRGLSSTLAAALHVCVEAMFVAFFGIFGVFLPHLLLRRKRVTVLAAALLILFLLANPAASHTWSSLAAALFVGAAWLTLLLRHGLLPAMVAASVAAMLATVPLTLSFGAWYAPGAVVVLLLMLGLGIGGLLVSLDGQCLLPDSCEEAPADSAPARTVSESEEIKSENEEIESENEKPPDNDHPVEEGEGKAANPSPPASKTQGGG